MGGFCHTRASEHIREQVSERHRRKRCCPITGPLAGRRRVDYSTAGMVAMGGGGGGEFLRHCAALHSKNITVAMRDRRATLMQLFASFFFMLFVRTPAVHSDNRRRSTHSSSLPEPRCSDFVEWEHGLSC